MTTEAFTYLNRAYEVRPVDEDDHGWQWREAGGVWQPARDYAIACAMCGGHARLMEGRADA